MKTSSLRPLIVIMLLACHGSQATKANAQSNESPQEPKVVSDADEWKTRLPVSMNGKYPSWPDRKYVDKYWHDSFWAQRGLSSTPIFFWKPEHWFTDEATIALCKAIKDKDIATMEKLIAAGADVNAKGGGNFNPLYWAFHVHDDPRPFECLIKHGADPNVIVYTNKRKGIEPNRILHKALLWETSVTHLVAGRRYNRLFKLVFENGGDPNLYRSLPNYEATAFQCLHPLAPDYELKLKLLSSKGANLDKQYPDGQTRLSISTSTGWFGESLLLLENGADHRLYYPTLARLSYGKLSKLGQIDQSGRYKNCRFRLIHILAVYQPFLIDSEEEIANYKKRMMTIGEDERSFVQSPEKQNVEYRDLVQWLEKHGESLAEAEADLKRWEKWVQNKQFDLIEQEHKLRLEKEKGQEGQEPLMDLTRQNPSSNRPNEL